MEFNLCATVHQEQGRSQLINKTMHLKLNNCNIYAQNETSTDKLLAHNRLLCPFNSGKLPFVVLFCVF